MLTVYFQDLLIKFYKKYNYHLGGDNYFNRLFGFYIFKIKNYIFLKERKNLL